MKLVGIFISIIPVEFFIRVWGFLLRARISRAQATRRMTGLLRLQLQLENLLADAGAAMGNGVHVKHRLTGYHEFFVERISKRESVLDVGCGIGVLAISIARRSGAKVVGIDFDRNSIELARAYDQKREIELVYGDATTYDFGNRRFDTIVMSNVLEHIEHRPRLLSALFKQTGAGRALIRVPVLERDWTVPMRRELGLEWRLDTTHFTEYTVPQFHQEMTEAGLDVVSLQVRWSEIWAEVKPSSA